MQSFKTGKYQTRKRFVTRWIWDVLFALAIITTAFYFVGLTKKDPYIPVIIFSLLHPVRFAKEIFRTYINEIIIDRENRQVIFHCYRPWNGTRIITRSFDDLKFHYATETNGWFLKRFPAIYFFKNEPGDFYVSVHKDGFSKQTLIELIHLLDQLGKPVPVARPEYLID
jgi:hypothetical protein